ncbi:RINT1-like protein isoform X4 [Eurosta solidaginis]|uniref:RINT1-like protein isoform X4 n=1 Tax=Eurosta solidaginis TaxID=178769 RepID=UPI003530EBB4
MAEVMEARINDRINSLIGQDCKDLRQATELVEHYRSLVVITKRKLNQDCDLEFPTNIKSAFQIQKLTTQTVDFQIEKLAQFESKLCIKIQASDNAFENITSDLLRVHSLQQLNQYLTIVQDIQEISHSLASAIQGKDEAKMVNIFLTLFEDNDCENSVIGRLNDIQAPNLKQYATNVGIYWHKLLTDKFARFQYHFTGIRQTNRLDKPEWFFTQVLNWGKEVHLFVGMTFQPAAVKAGKLNYNIRLEFIRGLVQLIVEKLAVDIEEISHDGQLFAHLLDEILAFESELRENFGYPSSFPSVISVVTQPAYLLKWISLEERFCAEKMDIILRGENPWMLIGQNLYDNELKIPKCADQFMRLLEAIKERYNILIQPGHQLQFLSLQSDLIENFRRRLVQLHSCGEVDSIHVLNAINYLTLVLSEWGENVHYLHLHVALVGPISNEIHSVFDHPVRELKIWAQDLIERLATKAVNEIKAKSMFYRHDCWSTMPDHNSKEPFILSPSAGEMFQIMLTALHNLERELSLNLFYLTLRIIASQIDEFLFESLVMNNKFTPGGAAQFSYDMSRNLFALFGQYSQRPELLFKRIHESNKLLNTTRGTALLLHETLITETPIDRKMEALKDLGVVNFKYQTCIEVLDRRTDIREL